MRAENTSTREPIYQRTHLPDMDLSDDIYFFNLNLGRGHDAWAILRKTPDWLSLAGWPRARDQNNFHSMAWFAFLLNRQTNPGRAFLNLSDNV